MSDHIEQRAHRKYRYDFSNAKVYRVGRCRTSGQTGRSPPILARLPTPRRKWRPLAPKLALGRAVDRSPTVGAVAQLGERLVRNEEVSGSIPLGSTNQPLDGKLFFVRQEFKLRSIFIAGDHGVTTQTQKNEMIFSCAKKSFLMSQTFFRPSEFLSGCLARDRN